MDELMHHRQQIIERQQQCAAQLDDDGLLSGTECCQQVFPRERAIVNRIAIAPVAYRRHRHAKLIGQRPDALVR